MELFSILKINKDDQKYSARPPLITLSPSGVGVSILNWLYC